MADTPRHDEIHPDDIGDLHRLVEDARAGDRTAFAGIFSALYSRVYATLLAQVGSRADAEEIANDVFVVVWKKIPTFTWQGAPFASWVMSIAMIEAARSRRKRGRRREQAVGARLDDVHTGSGEHAIHTAVSDDVEHAHSELIERMKSLPVPQRLVLALRFYGGMSSSEVATTLGMSADNVRQMQHRALKTLQSTNTSERKVAT